MALNKIDLECFSLVLVKKSKVTLYLLNLNVSSFSGAKVFVRIENVNAVGDWSWSCSKLVLCLG